MSKKEIQLPYLHRCDESCSMRYMFGFPVGPNPDYKDGKCPEYGQMKDFISPRIMCVNDEMWQNSEGSGGNFLRPDEIVINDPEIKIEFDYPLKTKFTFNFKNDKGFTRKQLVNHIVETYKLIYREEEETIQNQKIIPPKERGPMLNRNETDGKYGIFGHDIEDLWLEGMTYDKDRLLVTLSIGS